MQTQILYTFDSDQVANRFLNTLTNWSVAEVRAKLHGGSHQVLVSYAFDSTGFDSTASELDDLASSHGGHEISLGGR